VAQSGLNRKDIFVSEYSTIISKPSEADIPNFLTASKVYGRNQGYDKTLASVAKSLDLFKLSK